MAATMFDLTGHTALVTGGASGIGKAIAVAMIDHGANVLIGSRTAEKVEQATKELAQRVESVDGRSPAAGVTLDVTHDASVRRAVRKAVEIFGGLDILVNSAGTTKFVEHADLGGLDADISIASPMAVSSVRVLAFRERFLV